MTEVKIRQLKVDDVFPMVEILGKVIANIKDAAEDTTGEDRKSTRLNSSH
jgi:hypothetical protein